MPTIQLCVLASLREKLSITIYFSPRRQDAKILSYPDLLCVSVLQARLKLSKREALISLSYQIKAEIMVSAGINVEIKKIITMSYGYFAVLASELLYGKQRFRNAMATTNRENQTMPERQISNQFSLQPLGWRVWMLFFLTMVPLIQVIIGYLHRTTVGIRPEGTLLNIALNFFNAVSEFGVLAALFGLSFCTLLIGLRMVICPAAKRTKH